MTKTLSIHTTFEPDAKKPHYASAKAAGADVCAHIKEPITLQPGERILIPTGIKVAIPEGYEIQTRPRSGLALKHGITLLNSPGTIDADYRGDIGLILINHGSEPFTIEPQMRLAQLIVNKVEQAEFLEVNALCTTMRGEGGFGHTGTH